MVRDDRLFATVTKALTQAWRHVRFLDRKSSSIRNVIVAAGAVKTLKTPRLRIEPAIRGRSLAKTLVGYFFRPLR